MSNYGTVTTQSKNEHLPKLGKYQEVNVCKLFLNLLRHVVIDLQHKCITNERTLNFS